MAQDAAGNTSGPASTTVDSVAPATPVLDPSNGTVISGTAEASHGDPHRWRRQPDRQATADGSGNWSFTPGTPLANGSVINAVAQDAAGNTSGPVSTGGRCGPSYRGDRPSNGVELSGTAEPGVRVILTDEQWQPDRPDLADGGGNWASRRARRWPTARWSTPLAQDPPGNTSGPASTTVNVGSGHAGDQSSNGSVITGTAQVGAKVILTDGNGNPIGETHRRRQCN